MARLRLANLQTLRYSSNLNVGTLGNTAYGDESVWQVRYQRMPRVAEGFRFRESSQMKCEQESGWDYLFELEDSASANDFTADLAAGFKSPHAYYRGNDFLEQHEFDEVQFCAGVSSEICSMNCLPLHEAQIGHGITSGAYNPVGLSTNFKKLVACFTGQCKGNAYDSGFFWECNSVSCDLRKDPYNWANDWSDSQSSWNVPGSSSSYTSGIGPHGCAGSKCPVHVWGSGLTLRISSLRNVGTLDDGDYSGINVMQVCVCVTSFTRNKKWFALRSCRSSRAP